MLRTLALVTFCAFVAPTATIQATTPGTYLEGVKDATICHPGFWAAALLCGFEGPYALLGHAFGAFTRHSKLQLQIQPNVYLKGGRDAMAFLAAIELLRSITPPASRNRYACFFEPFIKIYVVLVYTTQQVSENISHLCQYVQQIMSSDTAKKNTPIIDAVAN